MTASVAGAAEHRAEQPEGRHADRGCTTGERPVRKNASGSIG
jgi:hypothetical protein